MNLCALMAPPAATQASATQASATQAGTTQRGTQASATAKTSNESQDKSEAADGTAASFDALLALSLTTPPDGKAAPALADINPEAKDKASTDADITASADEQGNDSAQTAVDQLLLQLPAMPAISANTRTTPPAAAQDTDDHPGDATASGKMIAALSSGRGTPALSVAEHAGKAAEPTAIAAFHEVTAQSPESTLSSESSAAPATFAAQHATELRELRALAESPAIAQKSVSTHFDSPGWRQDFNQQVSWLAKSDLQLASLTLNPPELGPVRVELQLSGHETSAHFSSPVPEVRQAIEAAMPELKTLLEASGLSLAEASVGTGLPGQSAGQGQWQGQTQARADKTGDASASRASAATDDATGTAETIAMNAATGPNRLVDLYA